MAGIATVSQGNMKNALSGLKRASDLQESRELHGMQQEQAYRQQRTSGIASGMATGATIGTAISPGWGTVIGAVVGAGVGYGATY